MTSSDSRRYSSPGIFVPQRIVSGGQTGVDRGALDAAIELGIEHGGWCPKGRMAEDGTIPDQYKLVENGVENYPARTRQNVQDSDATLILYERRMGGGTALTQKICRQMKRPHLVVRLDTDDPEASMKSVTEWLFDVQPTTLNIAGTRESTSPGVAERTRAFCLRLIHGG